MDFRATKDHQQRQEDEASRLVRPSPKVKPPRRDLRRERVQEADPDIDRPDKDTSRNFKDIGGSLVRRVVEAAKDRIPAKSRETGEVVYISPDTLKERPGEYEVVDPAEAEAKGKPAAPDEKGEPEKDQEPPKPKDEGVDQDEFYSKAGDALRDLAKDNPKLKDKLKQFVTPGGFFHGMIKENPAFPASKFFPDTKLPEGVQTIADVQKALESKPKAKPKQKGKGNATKSEAPPPEAPKEKPAEAPEDSKAKAPPEAADGEPSKRKAPESPEAPEDGSEDPDDDPDDESEPSADSDDDETLPDDAEDEKAPELKATSEAEKAGIGEPKRPPPSPGERQEALGLLLHTFDAETAAQFSGLHPHDVKALVRDYNTAKVGAKVANPTEFAEKVSHFYQTDPSKVKPPTEWRTKSGEKVPFDSLPSDEKAAAMRQQQMRIVALSLAAKDALTKKFSSPGALSGKPRIPPKLAALLSVTLLKKTPPERADKIANAVYSKTLKSSAEHGHQAIKESSIKKVLEQVKGNPVALKAAKAYFQANDYQDAKQRFLGSESQDQISERDSPSGIASGLKKADEYFKQRNAIYGDDHEVHPSQRLFRTRVLDKLLSLNPEKVSKVQEILAPSDERDYKALHSKWLSKHKKWSAEREAHEKAVRQYKLHPSGKKPPGNFGDTEPLEPQEPVTAAHTKDPEKASQLWDDAFAMSPKTASVFTYPRGTVMGSASKLGVYHGVDPRPSGVPDYPGWLQPHQREIGEEDFKLILAEAKDWLGSKLLAVTDEGMLPDTKFRAALDLAIYSSRYNGAIGANNYASLLARFAGVPERSGEPLLTIRASDSTSSFTPASNDRTGGTVPMKASKEVRDFATKVAKSNPKLGFEMLAFADRLAEEEKKPMPPWLKDKVDDKKDDKKDDDKKEASVKFASLRSAVITAAAADPAARQALLPVLKTIKSLG